MTEKESSCFVLVHGSWHTGDMWEAVAQPLRQAGHEVHTPTIIGHGKDADRSVSHADQVASIADYITGNDLRNIVLVGHSFGGTIISKLAEQMSDRIRRLVFYSGFVLKNNDCIMDELPPQFGPLFEQLQKASPDQSILMPFPIWRDGFMNDASFSQAKEAYDKLSPEPRSSFYDKLDLTKFYELLQAQKLACSYIHCTADFSLPAGEYNWFPRYISRLGLCRVVELTGAGHEALLTQPEALRKAIIMAGRD